MQNVRNVADEMKPDLSSQTTLKWAVWIAFIAQAWNSIFGTSTIAFLGSYNFTFGEVSMVSGAIALALGWRRYGIRPTVFTAAVGVFAAVTALNFMRGMNENPAMALVAARGTVPLAVLLLLGAVRYPGTLLRDYVVRSATAVAILLSVIVILRLVLGPQFLMLAGGGLNVADINDGGRALPAQGAFLIAVAAVLQLSAALRSLKGSGRSVALAAAFFVILVLTGQGTATIAAIAGLVVILSMEWGPALGVRVLIGSSFAVAVVILAISLQTFDPNDWAGVLPGTILENLDRRTANLGTREMVWRVAWTAYQQGARIDQIVGWPTGSTPELILVTRSWGHVVWTNSVHSMYFGVLLGQGAVGLAAYLTMLAATLINALHSVLRRQGAVPLALVLMIGIFSYSYGLAVEQALILAVAASALPIRNLARRPRQHRRVQALSAT